MADDKATVFLINWFLRIFNQGLERTVEKKQENFLIWFCNGKLKQKHFL